MKTLVPTIERLCRRLSVGQVCVAADRATIGNETIREIEGRNSQHVLGVRMRSSEQARRAGIIRGVF